jgi:hypothetical protein
MVWVTPRDREMGRLFNGGREMALEDSRQRLLANRTPLGLGGGDLGSRAELSSAKPPRRRRGGSTRCLRGPGGGPFTRIPMQDANTSVTLLGAGPTRQ